MKRFVSKPLINPPQAQSALPPTSAELDLPFDVQKLLEQSQEILRREIKNIAMESARGKLSAASAKDLIAYYKLLDEVKQEELALLEDMSDEELKTRAGAAG